MMGKNREREKWNKYAIASLKKKHIGGIGNQQNDLSGNLQVQAW